MTNFHEFVHLHESQTARRAQPGVSPRWTNIRWQVLCPVVQSPRDTSHHFSPNIRPRGVRSREEEKRHFYMTVTRSCEYKLIATVWPRYPKSTSCQCWDPLIKHGDCPGTEPRISPQNREPKVSGTGKCRKPPATCLTHLPQSVYTPRGNQASEGSEPRCFDQRVDLSLETQFMQFLYKRQCDCEGFSKYREGFVQYWFNAHFQF